MSLLVRLPVTNWLPLKPVPEGGRLPPEVAELLEPRDAARRRPDREREPHGVEDDLVAVPVEDLRRRAAQRPRQHVEQPDAAEQRCCRAQVLVEAMSLVDYGAWRNLFASRSLGDGVPIAGLELGFDADPLVAIAGGGGVNLYNSAGSAWTADYLKITGEMDVDLRSNIAAEARAKIVYERVIDFCDDAGSKDALQFLMTREITHMKAFMLALDSMGKPPLKIGKIAPTSGLVDQFFNDSTGEGEGGAVDTQGPWKDKAAFQYVDSPAFHPEKMNLDGPNGAGATRHRAAHSAKE